VQVVQRGWDAGEGRPHRLKRPKVDGETRGVFDMDADGILGPAP
jgi:hypothetical protein